MPTASFEPAIVAREAPALPVLKPLPVTEEGARRFSAAVEHARQALPKGCFVDHTTPEECLRDNQFMGLSRDGKTGAAVDRQGELKSLFNLGARGEGQRAIHEAVAHGANRVTCYGNGLRRLYARNGFTPVATYGWSGQTKPPAEWDDSFGNPALYIMSHDPNGTLRDRPMTQARDRMEAVAVVETVAAAGRNSQGLT